MPTISFENLRFGSTRYNERNEVDLNGLPSLYFVANNGAFTRIRPYHDDGFALLESAQRNIYLLSGAQHDTLKGIDKNEKGSKFQNRVTYLGTDCKNDLYTVGANVSGKEGTRIVDYDPNGTHVHRGHYLLTVANVEKVYAQHGIDLKKFITCMGNNKNAFSDIESKEEVVQAIKQALQ